MLCDVEARIVTLKDGDLQARFAAGVGMVGFSLTHRGAELLGQRGGLDAYVRRGSTFGLPLLHPWANRLGGYAFEVAGREVVLDADSPLTRTEEHGLPIHGLLAASPDWEVVDERPAAVRARVVPGDEVLRQFPFPHAVEVEARLDGGALHVATTLEPLDGAAVPVAFGWHPYLVVPQAVREDWLLGLPGHTHLELDDRGLPTGASTRREASTEPLGGRVLDDLLTDLDDPRLTLAGGYRRITLELGEGYSHAQLFAPPGQALMALEPMTAPTDALRTGDGLRVVREPFTARFAVGVELLDAPITPAR
ncbi:aldose 1-epimerase [Conexibacter sp. SYSU D00693]|uniref:aldose 1-epimerase n=1 Tax=Conexibacter sp. SYSU D00693 TaxID=2812560 RepID=UPI00196AE715|nr:aldose 1-epimerase [Conexibacter sp. SYSU D00693]